MDLKENKIKSKSKSKSKTIKSKSIKSKSINKSTSKTKSIKSKSINKSTSKTKSIKSKSIKSKSIISYSNINSFVRQIKREHGELDASYKMRLEFIQNCLNKNKVEKKAIYIPYLSTMSFVHYYKTECGNLYPEHIEAEYSKLL